MSLELHPLHLPCHLTPTQTMRNNYPLDQGDINPVIPASPAPTSWYWLRVQASQTAPEPVGGGAPTRGGWQGVSAFVSAPHRLVGLAKSLYSSAPRLLHLPNAGRVGTGV